VHVGSEGKESAEKALKAQANAGELEVAKDPFSGGSLTALPIIETQAGDVSAYIPTNVISITDGQIFLETDLFYSGIRPAINVGISVSRVGGNAQIKAMKSVAGTLRLDLAQYRAMAAFAQFASDLDAATRAQLARGERLVEILKQAQYQPLPIEKQVVIVYAGTKGFIDKLSVESLGAYEKELYRFIDEKHPEIWKTIREKKAITDDFKPAFEAALKTFTDGFVASKG
jgi:F-type H+-transporting ATPase subunit alpha